MKSFFARRLMIAAALLSPFIIALLYVSAAEAALIRGRGAARMQVMHAGDIHGAGTIITITLVALALIAITYVSFSRGLRSAPAVGEPIALPLRSDSSAEEDRRAA